MLKIKTKQNKTNLVGKQPLSGVPECCPVHLSLLLGIHHPGTEGSMPSPAGCLWKPASALRPLSLLISWVSAFSVLSIWDTLSDRQDTQLSHS